MLFGEHYKTDLYTTINNFVLSLEHQIWLGAGIYETFIVCLLLYVLNKTPFNHKKT